MTLRTTSRKWVYAQIDSEAPWLRVLTPSVSGPQQVQLAFEIDPAVLKEPGVEQTNLRILANGNQKLAVQVQVEVKRARAAAGSQLLRPMIVAAALLMGFRLLLALPADYFSRVRLAGTSAEVATLGYWMQLPVAESGFLRCFVLTTWWTGAVLGFWLVWRGRRTLGDRLCGLIAGSAAGLGGWSVLGCLVLLVDAGPRWLTTVLARMLGASLSPWISTPLWLLVVALGWAVLGAAVGFVLGLSGSWGIRILAGVCRFCGIGRAAGWLQGR